MPTTAQPGDVVLVRFPFTDPGLPQPPRETWIPLSTEDPAFSETGLKTSSVIKAERIAVIEQSIVVRKLDSLTPAKMDEVKRAVKLSLNL